MPCPGLGLKGVKALAGALRINQNVTVLRLADNAIPDEGVAELMRTLLDNTSITLLDISGNRMGPVGSKALADLLVSRVRRVVGEAAGQGQGAAWNGMYE